MKKSKLLIVLIVFIVLVVPFSVFAATSDTQTAKTVRGFFGIDASKLTDTQKADASEYSKKLADLQKEFVNKMVANGAMTKEQGDAAIKNIDDTLKASQENGTIYGMLPGRGMFGNPGKQGGFGKGGIDTSKLSDAQKADLADIAGSMTELQKELAGKLAADGLLTKEQSDNIISKIDKMSAAEEKDNFQIPMLMGRMGFFGFIRTDGADNSKLTDEQKADLDDFSKQMSDLQKKLIDKLVSYGVMTSEQGDAAIKRADGTFEFKAGNGNLKGMGKGRFKNKTNSEPSSTTPDSTAPAL